MFERLFAKTETDYSKFRWFFTSNNVLVVGGKSDEQNEIVLRSFLKSNYTVLHTSLPGSPFMILQTNNPSEKDIEEAGIFCASFSKQWKNLKNNSKVMIDVFKGNQIYKIKGMKKGTFGVKGLKRRISVSPKLVLVIQKGRLRAVPNIKNSIIKNSEILGEIKPGKMDKNKAADKIASRIKENFNYPISKDEILSAIPSDNMNIK